MKAPATALLVVMLGLMLLGTPASSQSVALVDARVVDPAAESVTRGVLVIQDGRVTGVHESVPPGFDGEVRDVEGRWVIPGLADLHTHSFGNGAPNGRPQAMGPQGVAEAALYTGVVAVLDLFSPEDQILPFRDGQRAAPSPGAEVFAAGPCLTATDGHCSEYGVPTRIVNSPEDAAREIDDLAGRRPDVIKVVYDNHTYGDRRMPTIDRPTLRAVVANAAKHGLKTVVHVGTWQDVRDAAEAGAAAVTHTPGPDPIPEDLAAAMMANGTAHIPTLAVQSDFARQVDDPTLLDDDLLEGVVTDEILDAYRSPGQPGGRIAGWLAWQRSHTEADLRAVKALADAGVTMLAGTDAGNFGVFQGYSVHRELDLLVEAGLSPWAALRAATTDAAAFLGRDWGVSAGAEGTVVVLDGSPIEDIGNTKRIHAVIQRGQVVDRAALRLR